MMIILVKKQATPDSSISKQTHPTSPVKEECLLETPLIEGDTKRGLLKKEKIKFIEYNHAYIEYAQQNRKKATKVESIFWYTVVKNKKFLWYKFRRQKVVWSFILDFYCSKLLLWIELDGWYHNNRGDYDRMRDAEIYKKWILVIRFRNEDVENNLLWIIDELEDIIHDREKEIEKSNF